MAFYEAVFVTRPDLSRQDVAKLVEEFTNIVKKEGGKVVKDEYWGLRSLAYKINKNSKGHYAMLCLDAPAPAEAELQRILRLHEDVVRHLVVRVDAISSKPSPMLRSPDEGEREDAA